jgi:hypothetical protein
LPAGAAASAACDGAALLAALPPARPAADVDPAVAERFRTYWAATQAGASFTANLRDKRIFGNPYLLEETIATFGIDDSGSALPRRLWRDRQI